MFKQWQSLCLTLLIALAPTAFSTETPDLHLPVIGEPSEESLNTDQERRLGHMFMHAVRQQVAILEDPACSAYIQSLGEQLVAHANTKKTFNFFIVDDTSINAFAGPGGYVGINTGLITTSSHEAELAAVLAHEITHVTQRHIARGMEKASQSTLPSMGAIIAALLLGGKVDPAITTGAVLSATAGSIQNTINYTRAFEKEADRIGMRVLYDTGFSPDAMPSFFARMQNRTLDYGDPTLKLLQTHPVTEDRIADSQNRAHQYANRAQILNAEYPFIKARIQVITAPASQDILSAFKEANQDHPSLANQYGYALALLRNHQEQSAQAILQKLLKQEPGNALLHLALIETEKSMGAKSIGETFATAMKAFPDNNAIILEYADTLLKNKQADQARKLLEKHKHGNEQSIWYFRTLAKAQGRSGHFIEAYQSRAEQFVLENQLERAITQLKQAKKAARDDVQTLQAIENKIAYLRHEINEMEQQ